MGSMCVVRSLPPASPRVDRTTGAATMPSFSWCSAVTVGHRVQVGAQERDRRGQELPEEMPWPQRGTVVCWLTRQDPAMTALTRNETRLVIPAPGQASQPPDTSDPSTNIRSDLLKWATETTHLWR